ncbi:MAG TPA: flagellar motor switch protein FliG, partial [Terriglobia bacterium]|nr:flagellar motor switch protein FliG [Terriglobia bacterium]
MRTDTSRMAATLFVLLGEETSSEVLRYLNEAEIETISKEISNVGLIAAEEAEKSAEELYQHLVANRFVSEGGFDYAKKVLLRTL